MLTIKEAIYTAFLYPIWPLKDILSILKSIKNAFACSIIPSLLVESGHYSNKLLILLKMSLKLILIAPLCLNGLARSISTLILPYKPYIPLTYAITLASIKFSKLHSIIR